MKRALLTLAALLLLAGCGGGSSSPTPAAPVVNYGPEDVALEQGPPLAPASTTTPGTTVNGIRCGLTEQLAYHIHAHLAVYVDGQIRQIPPGVGIVHGVVTQTPNGAYVGQGRCFYWLHTHAGDGIIHIESPSPRVYTLGDFFDIWGQPLSGSQVGPASGPITAYVNGRPWAASPRSIPLRSHNAIQLDVGIPTVPFQSVTSWGRELQ